MATCKNPDCGKKFKPEFPFQKGCCRDCMVVIGMAAVHKKREKEAAQVKKQKIEQEQKANAAPEIKEQINSNTSSLAPVVNESKNIVATIKTEKNIIEIDNLGRIYQVTLLEEKYKDDRYPNKTVRVIPPSDSGTDGSLSFQIWHPLRSQARPVHW